MKKAGLLCVEKYLRAVLRLIYLLCQLNDNEAKRLHDTQSVVMITLIMRGEAW
jgi:hypothetical protein